MSDPLSLMPSTLSMALMTFWSGGAVPRSKSWTMVTVVLHFVARSFCVHLGSISLRRLMIAWPTTEPTVLGLMISSLRSTFVRCWPSTAAFCSVLGSVYRGQGGQAGSERKKAYGVGGTELLLRADNGAGTLGCVESTLALDHSFPVDATGTRAAGLAADAGD